MSKIEFKVENAKISSIAARSLDADISGEIGVSNKVKSELIKYENSIAEIKITHNLSFNPSSFFEMTLETIGTVKLKEDYSRDIVEKNVKILSEPILPFTTLVIAFLSEKFIDTLPLILPPFFDEDTEESIEDIDN